jgi:hypothetical protein
MTPDKLKRPPTRGTRHGNGAGSGGPAKGAGWGGPAKGQCWGDSAYAYASGMGWGGPAKGAHTPRPRNLPGMHVVTHLDDMSLAEREAELQARSVVWRAKIRAFEARHANLRAYRAALIWGAPFVVEKARGGAK